jgi:crotonobetainyl-CoA:carnitine CoA-transferase CaiB-like acyl-CoA transferase
MGALDGVRVVDLTRYVAGPFCTLTLSDAGADVVKIEPPGGDDIRQFPSTLDGGSRLFLGLNRGKRSIGIDLKKSEGREIARRLAGEADVFVEGNRPGASERLGLGHEALLAANPRLVYVSVSAYGQKGPLSGQRGLDPILQSYAGIPTEQADGGTPELVQGHFLDYFTGSLAASAVLMALFERGRTGRGQYIDASLLGSAGALQRGRLVWAPEREPLENVHDLLSSRISRIYEAAAGYIYVYMDVDSFWGQGCDVLGLESLKEDPRFTTFRERHAAREEIVAEVQKVVRTASAEEWVKRFQKAGVPCAKVRRPADLLEDEQMRAMGFLTEVAHPELGPLRMMGAPFRMEAPPAREGVAPPLLGEHTDEVLAEAGYSDEEIEGFRKGEMVF